MSTLRNGLIAYYSMDGSSTDIIGGNNGTDFGITFPAGKIKQAAGFNGTNQYTRINQINSSVIHISFWHYLNSSSDCTFLRQGVDPVNFALYSFSGFYHFFVSGTTSNFQSLGTTVTSSSWRHLSCVFDWPNNRIKLYVNGLLVFNGAMGGGTYIFNNTTQGYNFTDIGRNVINNNVFINGQLDEMAFHNRELTQAEVNQLYNNGKGLSYPFVQSNFFPFFQ